MPIKDNFGNPKGVIGKLMLTGMNLGHSPMAKWAFTQFDVPAEGNIVDIGCGGGFNIKRLLDKSAKGLVYGVDISDVSVEKSKAVNKRHIGKRCEIYKGSADRLPFEDNFIDLATAFETVYFWKDMKKCFTEIKRVLRSGGKFVIVNDPEKTRAPRPPGRPPSRAGPARVQRSARSRPVRPRRCPDWA